MKIYIDSEFKCHAINSDNTFQEVETSFFDNKCTTFIEGYRFVPEGAVWIREDGAVFYGEMVAPWKDWNELNDAQQEHDHQRLADYEAALAEIEKALGV